MSRSRSWCFTLNNYNDDDCQYIVEEIPYEYLVLGEEVGENGTPHLQGYIYCRSLQSLKAMKQHIPRAHWEIAKGTIAQASDYCKKDGNFGEWGDYPQQGKRNDCETIYALVKEGKTYEQILEIIPSAMRMDRQIRDLTTPEYVSNECYCSEYKGPRTELYDYVSNLDVNSVCWIENFSQLGAYKGEDVLVIMNVIPWDELKMDLWNNGIPVVIKDGYRFKKVLPLRVIYLSG